MDEVYRARDTKLNRDVALKILPDAFALDGDRIARFHREAQVLASLNDPNLAHMYGFEEGRRTPGGSSSGAWGPSRAPTSGFCRLARAAPPCRLRVHGSTRPRPRLRLTAAGWPTRRMNRAATSLINGPPADPGPPMTVVLNWAAEVK
jgi:serine/threonine protein kinase